MLNKPVMLVLLLAVAVSLAPATGNAIPVVFFGEDLGLGEFIPLALHPNADAARDALMSHLVGVGTETFEGFSTYTSAPLALTFPGAGTATMGGDGYVYSVTPGTTNGVGRYAISGSNYWETTDQFSITFDQPIAAFGFYGVDIGDFSGQITLHMVGGGTVDLVVPNTVNGPGGSVLYYGFYDTDTQYTGITFGNTAAGIDFFGFDDMTIGSLEQVVVNPAPEPGTLALLGVGLLGLVRLRSSRRGA